MNIDECGNLKLKTDFSVINNPVIYYAHHMRKYNTQEEKEEVDIIENIFNSGIIINQNGWIYQCGNENYIMNQCLQLVKNSDILIFSTIENRIIGKGVYTEIECALKNNKRVYFLKDKLIEYTYSDFNKIELIYNKTKSYREYARVTT